MLYNMKNYLPNGEGGEDFLDSFLIVIIVMLLLGVLGLFFSLRIKAEAKKMGAERFDLVKHLHGLPNLQQKRSVYLYFLPEKLIIKVVGDQKRFELGYSQITAAEGMRKSDLEKNKSVIIRGVAGGVLLGPLGAIIGGMSGIGKKKMKGNFLVLNYRSPGENEQKVLIFDTKNILYANKLAEYIRNKASIKQTVQL